MYGVQQHFNFGEESSETFCSTDDRAITVGIGLLHEMLNDSDISLAKSSRQIASLIALSIKQMSGDVSVRSPDKHKRKAKERVKVLRELQKTLIEGGTSSKADSLDMDGPKFTFVFAAIVRLFGQALKDAGLDGNQAHHVMLQFSDLVKANDERMKRELNQIKQPANMVQVNYRPSCTGTLPVRPRPLNR